MFLAFLICGVLLSSTGCALMAQSLVLASRRGHWLWLRFWAPTTGLLPAEITLNRVGFILAIVGLMLLIAPLVFDLR